MHWVQLDKKFEKWKPVYLYHYEQIMPWWRKHYCVKTVQIRRFFWSVFFYIQSKYRKIRAWKNSVIGHFFTQCIVRSKELYHLFFREISICQMTKITKFQATSFWNEYSIPIQLILSFHHFSAKKNNQLKKVLHKV